MKITFIGAGKVGSHLARKLHGLGHSIVQVYSRNLDKAKALAQEVGAGFTSDLAEIAETSDLYLLVVPDDAVETVAARLTGEKFHQKLVAHTSGATPLAVLSVQKGGRCGVFYPLQSFSLGKIPDFTQIPFCVDATSADDLKLLKNLAFQLSPKVYVINDQQRAVLHVAAVFANNFTNHLFNIAHQILENQKLPFELLLPLIQETVEKLKSGSPAEMQTGPAIRGDEATIERHLRFLENYPSHKKIYELLTQSIMHNID